MPSQTVAGLVFKLDTSSPVAIVGHRFTVKPSGNHLPVGRHRDKQLVCRFLAQATASAQVRKHNERSNTALDRSPERNRSED